MTSPAAPKRPRPRSAFPKPARRSFIAALASIAALLPVAGCIARGRPIVATAGPSTTAGMRVADTFDAFAMARAGDDLHVLAVSGGGQDGAYGAGVLAGWRSAGRPVFDVVTGVSAGSLLAPHAFLGTPLDDETMRITALTTQRSDVLCERSHLALVFGAAANDSRPLERGIARLFANDTIDRVAVASQGGRRLLLVATTNIDAGTLAIWDLGAIARMRKYDRFRTVLLASSSPPLLTEPVFIDGEMHADGGVMSNVFVPDPEQLMSPDRLKAYMALAQQRSPGRGTRVTIHVIMNVLLSTAPACVSNSALKIGSRTVDLVLSAATVGALWQLYGLAKKRGYEVKITSIPESLRPQAEDFFAFDPESMRILYDAGVAAGRVARTWRDEPTAVEGN